MRGVYGRKADALRGIGWRRHGKRKRQTPAGGFRVIEKVKEGKIKRLTYGTFLPSCVHRQNVLSSPRISCKKITTTCCWERSHRVSPDFASRSPIVPSPRTHSSAECTPVECRIIVITPRPPLKTALLPAQTTENNKNVSGSSVVARAKRIILPRWKQQFRKRTRRDRGRR